MAKNIEFKGLLNTVPYFFMWGNVWGLWKNIWVDSGENDNWLIMYGNGDKRTEMACKMGID